MCRPCRAGRTVGLGIMKYKIKQVHKNMCLSFLETSFTLSSSTSLVAEVDPIFVLGAPIVLTQSPFTHVVERQPQSECYIKNAFLFQLYIYMPTRENFVTSHFDWPYCETGHAQVVLIATT